MTAAHGATASRHEEQRAQGARDRSLQANALAVRATGQSDAVEMHGKHQRSSRERMLAAVLVGRPRLAALNADFAPEAVAYGLRAVRVSRP